jgi:hypothetical protein
MSKAAFGPVVVLAAVLSAGCSGSSQDAQAAHRPQRAGKPMDTVETAAHLGAARVAALTGDQEALHRNAEAISEDMRRAMKMPDATRPIDHEAARNIARAMPDVVSAVWLDRSNFLVRVAGAQARSEGTIDELCYRLESLGDTLAVVVHLQDASPETRDGMDTLSRNCQLAMGDHAFMQGPRKVDVLDPAVRAQQRANTELARYKEPSVQTAGDRAAIEAIPEM